MTLLHRLGEWCARHSWRVLAFWVVALVAATLASHALGGAYSDDFTLPSSPAQHAADVLAKRDPQAGGQTGQLVFTGSQGVDGALANVAKLPHVLSVSAPQTSKGVTYATVHFDTNPVQLGEGYVRRVDAATKGAHVDYGGTLGQAARPKGKDVSSELIGIGVAIAVLLLGFGSVYAAGLPIVTAAVGVFTGLGLLGMLASGITFATVSPTLAVMMGLGVGIDYGLFMTTRHRQQVMDGADPVTAAARTTATSGHAVLVAASTVVIAMLGLYASGVAFIGKLGLAAGIAVATSALAALTLVPALLGLLGGRLIHPAVKTPVAEPRETGGGWHAYAQRIADHPWRFLIAGVALLLALAIPVASMQLGHIDAGADPHSFTDKRAYDAIAHGFGPGANGQFTVIGKVPKTPGIASVTAAKDGVSIVTPTTGPQDAGTDALLHRLRDDGLQVTGTTAFQLDFKDKVAARLPVIIAVVVGLALLLLLVTFRAPVLALKAALLNLLSIGAAYGVVVTVFQWGWGGSALGVSEHVPVESYVPMMMFAIVFGLSMDYEVFLLSRVRESWLAGKSNQASVADGLSATGRVISCAALIMASVFFAFLLSPNVVIKMLALGLGVSVLIDATVIRLAVVPATMFLLGKANWWTPSAVHRLHRADRARSAA